MSDIAIKHQIAGLKPAYAGTFHQFDHLPDSASVRAPVVAALNGISPGTVWRWVKMGRLPQPSKRGGVTAWRVGDLRRAMAETV